MKLEELEIWELCKEEYLDPIGLKNPEWQDQLGAFFDSKDWGVVSDFLSKKIDQKQVFFPFPSQVFSAFNLCDWDNVKVVIIGQDPYHSFEFVNNKIVPHAQGVSFSISEEAKKIPPSLRNIFKALESEIPGFEIPESGSLDQWGSRGVLLLNTVLTVDRGHANSHKGIGWEKLTDLAISQISSQKSGVVFLLWGKHAQAKSSLIDNSKHKVISCAHPSPFSAHRGFFEERCFEQVEEILGEGIWRLGGIEERD